MEKNTQIPVIQIIFCNSLFVLNASKIGGMSGVSGCFVFTLVANR